MGRSNKAEFLPQLLRSSKTTRLKASSHQGSRHRLVVGCVLKRPLQCTNRRFRLCVRQVTLPERLEEYRPVVLNAAPEVGDDLAGAPAGSVDMLFQVVP